MANHIGKFAVIHTGGKQYQVSAGDTIVVEKLNIAAGEKVTFDKVLMVDDGSTTQIGAPYLDGAKVMGEIISEKRGKRVLGMKYKAKSNRQTKYGHRQTMATVKIVSIS